MRGRVEEIGGEGPSRPTFSLPLVVRDMMGYVVARCWMQGAGSTGNMQSICKEGGGMGPKRCLDNKKRNHDDPMTDDPMMTHPTSQMLNLTSPPTSFFQKQPFPNILCQHTYIGVISLA